MTESLSWSDLVRDAGEAGAFEPVPDGDYDLLVTEAIFKPSKQGKKMWNTKNRIEGGPHNGRVVWDNLVVTADNPNALMFFFRKMAALGLSRDFFQSNPSDMQVAESLKGKRFRATLATRTYNGNRTNNIQVYHPQQLPLGGNPATLPPSVVAAAPPPHPAAAAPPRPAAPPPSPAPSPSPQPAPERETEQNFAPPVPPPVEQHQETNGQEPAYSGAVPAPSLPPPPPF